jgi:hypothetical protein
MASRRKARNPDEIQQAQEAKADAKAQQMAMNALMAFPASREDWDKKVKEPALKAARDVEGAKEIEKRFTKQRADIFKISPYAWGVAQKLLKMKSSGERIHWLIQVLQILRYEGVSIDMDMVERYSKPGEDHTDEGPVFDATPSGKRTGHGGQQDRPADKAGAEGPSDGPTPGVPLDEAQRAFEENAHKAPRFPSEEELAAKQAAINAQRERDEQDFAKAEEAHDGKTAGDDPAPEAASNVVPIKRRGGSSKVSKRAPLAGKAKDAKAVADKHVTAQKEGLTPGTKPKMLPPQPPVDLDIDENGIPAFIRNSPRKIGASVGVFDPALDVSGID